MRLRLEPTENQTFVLRGNRGCDFAAVRRRAAEAEQRGDYLAACQVRYEAFGWLVDALPDDEPTPMEWSDPNTQAALETVRDSAADNFVVGDFELAAAQLEMLLDCDGEDHTGATPALALCYAALGEWECLDEIQPDLDDRSPLCALLAALHEYVAGGAVSAAAAAAVRRFEHLWAELGAAEHPVGDDCLKDISPARPSPAAQARDMWLQFSPIFTLHPGFTAALLAAAQ